MEPSGPGHWLSVPLVNFVYERRTKEDRASVHCEARCRESLLPAVSETIPPKDFLGLSGLLNLLTRDAQRSIQASTRIALPVFLPFSLRARPRKLGGPSCQILSVPFPRDITQLHQD